MRKHKINKLNLIARLFGIFLVFFGLIMAIIPMINFNARTFKLLPVIMFAIAFPFVGLVIIVLSYMINTDDIYEEDTEQEKETIEKNKPKRK